MVTFIKWLVPFLTTALTISIGFLITVEWMQSVDDSHAGLGIGMLYLILILPFSLGIGVAGGVALSGFVISRILKEKPSPPKTPSQLICGKCNNKSTDSWQWQYCKKCGNSLKNALIFNSETSLKNTEIKPKPKGDDEFGLL